MSVFLLTGEVLPGLVGLPKVDGSLQNPKVRTGRVCELYQNVGHVEELQRHRDGGIHIKEHIQILLCFCFWVVSEISAQLDGVR